MKGLANSHKEMLPTSSSGWRAGFISVKLFDYGSVMAHQGDDVVASNMASTNSERRNETLLRNEALLLTVDNGTSYGFLRMSQDWEAKRKIFGP